MTDASFGVIAIWNDSGTERFLIVQSKQTNEWSFPKGHAEAGETEIQSALRELEEETGIKEVELIENLSYIDSYSYVRDGQKITIQEKEIADYKWATLDEAITTISFDRPKEILKNIVAKNN